MNPPARPPLPVLLAAGASTRLGQPKALAEIHGAPAVEHLLRACAPEDGEPMIVVTGRHGPELGAVLGQRRDLPALRLLPNPDWARGRVAGLALAAAQAPERDLLVAPVDCPLVPREVVRDLLGAWAAAGAPALGWLAPRAPDGRHGHPLVLGRDLARRLPELPPGASLRDLRQRAEPCWGLAVSQVEILDDLDTPEDLERLRARRC